MRCLLGLSLTLVLAAGQPQTQPPGILLTNGLVVDGTGGPPRPAAVRIRGDRIVEIAPALTSSPGEQVIDVSGLTVTPGFIDVHSHADRA